MATRRLSQEEILSFLASPAASGGLPVTRIDTHGASVFLSGTRALKVKRAVKFSFLDYSTLELRKRACLLEIEVNRPFAPQLYLGVARITQEPDGSLKVGGEGEVVEWAVEMTRFDEALTLDHFAKENEIPPQMAAAIAKRLAEVHRSAPRQDADAWINALKRFISEHAEAFAKNQNFIDQSAAKLLRTMCEAALQRCAPLIRERADSSLLVRGHGDLHLGNIALIKGEPVIFDAVEFDPLIASGDVLYDLAFLLMDLVEQGQRIAANAALNAYLSASKRTENLKALQLLPLFLAIRSSIRAIVALARFERSRDVKDANAAKKRFDFACRFIRPGSPRMVAIGGLSGTGKSYLARLVAPYLMPEPGAVVLRSDVKRKDLFGVQETTRLGAQAYTKETGEKVYAALITDAATALSAGHSVIVDAVFASAEERESIAKTAEESGVEFSGIFLRADLATRLARIDARRGDASDADRSVALAQESYAVEAHGWAVVDSARNPDDTLQAALSVLGLSTQASA